MRWRRRPNPFRAWAGDINPETGVSMGEGLKPS
jgi:hypothetical protein